MFTSVFKQCQSHSCLNQPFFLFQRFAYIFFSLMLMGAFNWQFIRCWFINLTFVVLLTETLSHETSAGTFFYLGSLLCLNVKFNKMEHLSHPPQHPFAIQRFRIISYIMFSMLEVVLFDKRTSWQHTTVIVILRGEYPHRNKDCIAPVLP